MTVQRLFEGGRYMGSPEGIKALHEALFKKNHYGWEKRHLTGFTPMTPTEEEKYKNWRFDHPCLSTIEFIIRPSPVGQGVCVRCNKCGEEVDITDYDAA